MMRVNLQVVRTAPDRFLIIVENVKVGTSKKVPYQDRWEARTRPKGPLTPGTLLGTYGTPGEASQRVVEAYLAQHPNIGKVTPVNSLPSLDLLPIQKAPTAAELLVQGVPFEKLPGWPYYCCEAGCSRCTQPPAAIPPDPETEPLVEHMARAAHDAWWRAQLDAGTTTRQAPWGEEFMVPFDALSERGREFDRVIMRAILGAFREHGYRVERTADGDPSSR